jgi:hypothetical protein
MVAICQAEPDDIISIDCSLEVPKWQANKAMRQKMQ